ncbi:LysR family transcriptional regulator [Pararhodobacter sp.]|uniref:LysR family transcriptional regulator n=1 Tax=Pararhodobacter sp. TaxID=2127056 RepID=UPI002FDDC8BF
MNLVKLRHVVNVDRCGSITQAAQMMNVTQSAVTKSVADVEREIGYPLFDRRARGVATTDAGRIFIDRARRITADIEQLIEDSRAQRTSREMALRLVICPSSLEGLLNRAVRRFITTSPACRVHLFASTIERGIEQLRQGDVDICFGARDRLEAVADFNCHPLPDLVANLFVRQDHPLVGRKDLRNEDIAAYPIIVPDLQGPYIERILGLVNPLSVSSMRQLHILENFPMVTEIVSATDTIGIVSNGYSRTDAFLQRFKTLPFGLGAPMPLAAATRARWPATRQMTLFMSALEKHPLTGLPRRQRQPAKPA